MNVRLDNSIKKGVVTKVPLKGDIKVAVEKPEELTENKSTEKTDVKRETEKTDSDKIFGMSKKVAYGLGAVLLLVGGYFAYKKFKK